MSGHLPAFVALQACERNLGRLKKGESSAFVLTILHMKLTMKRVVGQRSAIKQSFVL